MTAAWSAVLSNGRLQPGASQDQQGPQAQGGHRGCSHARRGLRQVPDSMSLTPTWAAQAQMPTR